jgi:hypothetical protein
VQSFAFEVRESLWAANKEMAPSLLGFAPIQRIERKQDPTRSTQPQKILSFLASFCQNIAGIGL